MKIRSVVALVVGCVLAGLAGWYLSQPKAGEATASAQGQTLSATTTPAPAQSPIVLPVKVTAPVVQVEAPVVAPAPIGAAPAEPAPAANEPQRQSDLKSCIAQTITLLQARDLVGLVKTIMPPTEMQRMIDAGQATDPESIAAQVRADIPTIDQDMTDLLQALQSVQGQEPEMNADGTRAVYHLSAPIGRLNDVTFEQQDGKWYFQ
jgi:hypothetical protein